MDFNMSIGVFDSSSVLSKEVTPQPFAALTKRS